MTQRKKKVSQAKKPRISSGVKSAQKFSWSWILGSKRADHGVGDEITPPKPIIFLIRLIVMALGVLVLLKLIMMFNPFRKPGASPAPVAVVSQEMAKPVAERRMTETFTFDGVKTKWGYSGWTKDGSANPNRDKGIFTDQKLAINGVEFETGLGTHAPSKIVFDLKGKMKKFSCKVGIDRGGNDQSSVIFKVFGDRKKLFQSPVMKVKDPAAPVQLNVMGIQELSLEVDAANPDGGWAQGDWVEIKFE